MIQEEQRRVDGLNKNELLFLWPLLFYMVMLPFMSSEAMSLTGLGITAILAFVLFLANHSLRRRQDRIERVLTAYFSQLESGKYTNGLDALLKSGATELTNRFEMYEVCRKIRKRGKFGQHPNSASGILPNYKLLAFLKFCQKNHQDISSGSDTLIVISQFNGEIEK